MNTQNFLQEKTNQGKGLSEVRSFLYKNYIKTVIEDTNLTKKRVMFISNRRKSQFTNPLSSQMNGLITEYDETNKEWKILMVPTPNFNSSPIKMVEVEHFYKQQFYTVCKVYDGTIINLYYYNDNWRISSNKGYDVTDLPINQEYTYKELLLHLSLNYPDFKIENLDINKCYTFCMKYNKIHLFEEANKDSNYIVLIQSVDLKTLIIQIDEQIGLPIQETYNNITYPELYNNKKNSADNYKLYLKSRDNTLYEHNYGYILKSNQPSITQQYSYIYLESELMKNIRRFIYDYRFLPDYIKQNKPNNFNMILLNILKNIINNHNDEFKKYFPKYNIKYDIVKKFLLNDLPSHIMKNMNVYKKYLTDIHSIKNNTKIMTDVDNFYINQFNVNEINKISMNIYSYMVYNNININIEEGKSILIDLIDIKYINEYYNCLSNIFI